MIEEEDDGGAAHEPEMDQLRDSLFEELAAASQDAEILRLRARVAELEAASAWQTIEKAPRDRLILVYAPSRDGLPEMVSLCKWHPDAGFCIDELRDPTHWMPLPPPPEAAL